MNTSPGRTPLWTVADLFSGTDSTGIGFDTHPGFDIFAAAGAQMDGPGCGPGTAVCNDTYQHDIGIRLAQIDPAGVSGPALPDVLDITASPTVLTGRPPRTGSTRVVTADHRLDGPHNSLVATDADFVAVLKPATATVANARELIDGRFAWHHRVPVDRLRMSGCHIRSAAHLLTRLGPPRALQRAVIATIRQPLMSYDLLDCRARYRVRPTALHVHRPLEGHALGATRVVGPADPTHTAPGFALAASARRTRAVPPRRRFPAQPAQLTHHRGSAHSCHAAPDRPQPSRPRRRARRPTALGAFRGPRPAGKASATGPHPTARRRGDPWPT